MSLGSHQRSVGLSQNHITPRWIIDALGPFDLDPAAANPRPWDCAAVNWTVEGLIRVWFGLVSLNPPFDRYVVGDWIAKLAAHGNGIALLHARTEAEWFEPIWEHAAAILFMADRIHFHRPDGSKQPANSGAPPILAAFGNEALRRLQCSGIAGRLVPHCWHYQPAALQQRSSAACQLAIQIFPTAHDLLNLKRHHQRAEAMLFALYTATLWDKAAAALFDTSAVKPTHVLEGAP